METEVKFEVKTEVKTEVKRKQLDPVYNQIFHIPIEDPTEVVRFTIEDLGIVSNTLMGVVEVPLAELQYVSLRPDSSAPTVASSSVNMNAVCTWDQRDGTARNLQIFARRPHCSVQHECVHSCHASRARGWSCLVGGCFFF